jgi:hypothetical protein
MKKLFVIIFILFVSILAYAKDIQIKNEKGELVGKLKLSSGTTYNVYNSNGVKIGTYKAGKKLTATNMKGKKFKLIKTGNTYTIKE